MAKKGDLIVGLDVGTTKVCAIVGEVKDNAINILGVGSHPSRGLREGVVINVEATVNSIKKAVEDAEIMADSRVSSVYAAISGSHIKSFNSHGVIGLKEKEVQPRDIEKVMEAAKAVAIPQDREVFHILPQEFIVDDQGGIKEPLGMNGVRLEAKVHMVTGSAAAAQNIVKCANKNNLEVKEIVLQSLAAAASAVSPEEKDLGVALMDIGGGTTDIALFCQGAAMHTAVLPLGGNHITSDVSIGLRTPAAEAERIKKKFGCALRTIPDLSDSLEVVTLGERSTRVVARKLLAEIIEARAEEILELARQEIIRSGFDHLLAAGVVLSGGTAELNGLIELAEVVFGMPARVGLPNTVGGLIDTVLSPGYATAVGLLIHGAVQEKGINPAKENGNLLLRASHRMRDWLAQF